VPAPKKSRATSAKKSSVKKPSVKKPVEVKPKAPAVEIWRCKVDWVKFHGKKYHRGDTLLVPLSTSEAEMQVIRRYFKLTNTESILSTSEPVEVLKEGD